MAHEILKLCMSKGFLLDREMLDLLSGLKEEKVREVIAILSNLGIEERVITKNLFKLHFDKFKNLIIQEYSAHDANNFFKEIGYTKENFDGENPDEENSHEKNLPGKVKLLFSPAFLQKKISVNDFVKHFRSRYEVIRTILEERELENLTSLRKIKESRGNYTIIAAVMNKRFTKNKNLFIEVEDLTGNSVVLVNQNRKDVFKSANDLLVDDIVAFKVSSNGELLFADEIIYPETSLGEKKYGPFDEYSAFCSDIHVGSTMFLEKNLLKFIKWLNGEVGDNHQRSIAKKVKYLFLTGDNVDGVGVFPGQEKFLKIPGMKGQYEKLAEILKLIREDVKIIIAPGQHDAVWVGEPQPMIGEHWAPKLHEMPNVTLVPNPSLVEIDGGFKVLMYHGASMHGIIESIPEIRLKYGHNNPTRVVKEMLKRRHLAPMHGLSDYIPCEKDPLVIHTIPDIISTGDQHRTEVSTHNNILLIASSCWQSKTPFEEKVGNNPDPCKVPLFNLKTREIKILDFSDEAETVKVGEMENGI